MTTTCYRHATDIAGYSYQADTYCPSCIVAAVTGIGCPCPDSDTENHLDGIAAGRGIDRYDERSYDSGDFPKVIFVSDLEGDDCCACGGEL